jgi:hypothetical protein
MDVLIAGLLWAALGPSVQAERPGLPLLTRIEDIRALSPDEGQRGYPIRIRATVTHFDENLVTTLIVHDGAFGQFVQPPDKGVVLDDWARLKAGRRCRNRGPYDPWRICS